MKLSSTVPYAGAIGLGSFLLFQIQPMIARFILPWFGGSPAVWTTCLLFFQLALLVGYAYAHALASRVEPRRQALVHLLLLAVSLATLPIIPALHWKTASTGGTAPVLVILLLLTATIGVPYWLLSSTSPLLQHWFRQADPTRSPYRLYALSNFGSLLGLVSYPFLFEPLLPLRPQAVLWSGAYVLYAACAAACAVPALRQPRRAAASPSVPAHQAAPIPLAERLLWVALAATGTLALMATSNHLVQDMAPMPLLWMLPLALYLVSMVLCFDSDRWAARGVWTPAFVLALPVTVYLLYRQGTPVFWKQILVYSGVLFASCMVVHGELARRRPPAEQLTTFYLHVAAGGAVGGAFVTFAAPFLFDGYWEFQLALVATWLLAGVGLVWARGGGTHWWRRAAWGSGGLALAAALAILIGRERQAPIVSQRNFYGVLRVVERSLDGGQIRSLYNNRVLHGSEALSGPLRGQPITYYGRESGVALAWARQRALHARPLRVGVIGLGAGTLATYAQRGDATWFYDINPDVIRIANQWFGNLRGAAGTTTVVQGDARISLETALERDGPLGFDILVLDAFTGDAVPAHLLTREAFAIYLRHLQPDGVLAVHISNRHLDLSPLIRGLSRDAALRGVLIDNEPPPARSMYEPSQWVLLTRNAAFLADSAIMARVDTAYQQDTRAVLWTDDYSNLLSVLR